WIALEANNNFQPGSRSVYQIAIEKAPTRAAVLLALTRMETEQQERVLPAGLTAAAVWINDGLEIEDTQRMIRFQRQTVNAGSSEREHVLLARRRISLWRRIVEWRARATEQVEEEDQEAMDPNDRPEEERIDLPSSMPPAERSPELARVELQLREGQANDALKGIRVALSQMLVLRRDKQANVRGQVSSSRASGNIQRLNTQTKRLAEQYRQSYLAMIELGMPATHQTYRPLRDADLNSRNVFETNRPLGRGNEAPISWIWHMHETNGERQFDNDWLDEGKAPTLYGDIVLMHFSDSCSIS
ncbi:hypothetical protein M408DRAFT_313788, partial [Serendipita vermifera MAFF 305830]